MPLFLAATVTVIGFLRRPLLARTQCPGVFLRPAFRSCRPHWTNAGWRRCSLSPRRSRMGPKPTRLFVGVLEVMWWLSAAWLASVFLRCVRRAGATAARHEIGSGPLGRAHLPCGAASCEHTTGLHLYRVFDFKRELKRQRGRIARGRHGGSLHHKRVCRIEIH